jgi:hypothetical protein
LESGVAHADGADRGLAFLAGREVVVEDYVHGFALKSLSLVLSAFVHALVAVSGIYAVLHIALRSAS